MTEHLHPGPHPDADQLSTFLEGAISARERELMLAHLTACPACREMVFLAQAPDASIEAPVAVAPRTWTWSWRRWRMPLSLAGAALACGLIALVYLTHHRALPGHDTEIAGTAPETKPNDARLTALQAPRAVLKPAPVPAPASKSTPPSGAAGATAGVIGGLFSSGKPLPLEPAPRQENAAALPPFAADKSLPSAAPQAPASPSPADSAIVATPATQPSTAKSAPAVAAQIPDHASMEIRAANSFKAQTGAPALKIEHGRGPDDGFSQLSGMVTDANGAVVSHATVTARAGTATHQVSTNADGRFTLQELPAGHYDVHVIAPGFRAASEQIDLKPRDLALLHSTLQVGASAETVEVTAAAPTQELQTAEVNANVAELAPDLPSRNPALTTVISGALVLSVDSRGTLFLSRDSGKSWKKVKPQWTGKIQHLALVPQAAQSELQLSRAPTPSTLAAAQVFQLITDSGAVWTSPDGTHWHAR